jgi:hypothetical protein
VKMPSELSLGNRPKLAMGGLKTGDLGIPNTVLAPVAGHFPRPAPLGHARSGAEALQKWPLSCPGFELWLAGCSIGKPRFYTTYIRAVRFCELVSCGLLTLVGDGTVQFYRIEMDEGVGDVLGLLVGCGRVPMPFECFCTAPWLHLVQPARGIERRRHAVADWQEKELSLDPTFLPRQLRSKVVDVAPKLMHCLGGSGVRFCEEQAVGF